MSSLEIIKQELIKQKALLENKGFPVTIANINPSPTEISDAIGKIDIKLSETDATEQDVRLGKTFISQTQGIKTGVLETDNIDAFQELIDQCVSGSGGDVSKLISSNITRIRPYAFWSDTDINANMFYATDFTIPSNITTIGKYAFRSVKLSGKLVIPKTCKNIDSYAFTNATMTEVELYNGLGGTTYYVFSGCKQLIKITFGPELKYIPIYTLSGCSALDEIIIQTPQATWSQTVVSTANAVTKITFESATPNIVNNLGFSNVKTAMLLVPYQYYDAYFNATNYQQYSNPMYGFGNFLTGKQLPSEQGLYSLVWYASLEDLQAGTNPVTNCTEDGRYYAVFTDNSIIETETTE